MSKPSKPAKQALAVVGPSTLAVTSTSQSQVPNLIGDLVWVQTFDGTIKLSVPKEVLHLAPYINKELAANGRGTSDNYPVILPKQVTPDILKSVATYVDFHSAPGRSDKERKQFDEKFVKMDTKKLCELTSAADSLEMRPLVDMTSRALARLIEGKTPDEIREAFNLPDDLTEEEKLEPVKNLIDDPRIRLLNRLYAKKRKELQAKKHEEKKAAEERSRVTDTRSLDELLSFIEDESGKKQDDAAGPSSSKGSKVKKKKKVTKPKKESADAADVATDSPAEEAADEPASTWGHGGHSHAQEPSHEAGPISSGATTTTTSSATTADAAASSTSQPAAAATTSKPAAASTSKPTAAATNQAVPSSPHQPLASTASAPVHLESQPASSSSTSATTLDAPAASHLPPHPPLLLRRRSSSGSQEAAHATRTASPPLGTLLVQPSETAAAGQPSSSSQSRAGSQTQLHFDLVRPSSSVGGSATLGPVKLDSAVELLFPEEGFDDDGGDEEVKDFERVLNAPWERRIHELMTNPCAKPKASRLPALPMLEGDPDEDVEELQRAPSSDTSLLEVTSLIRNT